MPLRTRRPKRSGWHDHHGMELTHVREFEPRRARVPRAPSPLRTPTLTVSGPSQRLPSRDAPAGSPSIPTRSAVNPATRTTNPYEGEAERERLLRDSIAIGRPRPGEAPRGASRSRVAAGRFAIGTNGAPPAESRRRRGREPSTHKRENDTHITSHDSPRRLVARIASSLRPRSFAHARVALHRVGRGGGRLSRR